MALRKPHKHAELIKAWVEGAEIEWVYATQGDGTKLWTAIPHPVWYESHEYRIKPEPQTAEQQSGYSRLEWAEDLIKQLPETHDGRNSWLLNYGTKPEPKPDRSVLMNFKPSKDFPMALVLDWCKEHEQPTLKLTFDGETGELKSAEVLK